MGWGSRGCWSWTAGHGWVLCHLPSSRILGPGRPLGLEMTDNSQWDPQPRLKAMGPALGPRGQVWESWLSPGVAFGQPRDGAEKAPTVCVAWIGGQKDSR